MFSRMFGKPKQEANALTTLDKLNEVCCPISIIVSDSISLLLEFGLFYEVNSLYLRVLGLWIGRSRILNGKENKRVREFCIVSFLHDPVTKSYRWTSVDVTKTTFSLIHKMIIWSKIQTGVFSYAGVFTLIVIRACLSEGTENSISTPVFIG